MGRLKLTGRIKEIFKTSIRASMLHRHRLKIKSLLIPHVEMVCVAGAEYPQPHCMIVLFEDAQAKRSDEAFRQELEASLTKLLKEVNASIEHHEQLQFFAVVSDEWTIETIS